MGFFLEQRGLGFRDWGFDRVYKVCRVHTVEKGHRVCMVESLKLGDGQRARNEACVVSQQ